MSLHPARPLQPDLTTVESFEPTGDSVLEMKGLLPFDRNASAASYTYSDSSESVSDRPQEDTPKAADFASSSTCHVSSLTLRSGRQLSAIHLTRMACCRMNTMHKSQSRCRSASPCSGESQPY